MKHCKNYGVLMVGRVCGGIATSLLFSVFESWLIRAHGERGLSFAGGVEDGKPKEKEGEEERWLANSLSVGMYGSSLVAIGSGILANSVVEWSGEMRPLTFFNGGVRELLEKTIGLRKKHDVGGDMSDINGSGDVPRESLFFVGGYIAAFDMALVSLVACAILIIFLWEENYGEATGNPDLALKHSDAPSDINGIEFISKEKSHSMRYRAKQSSEGLENECAQEEGADNFQKVEDEPEPSKPRDPSKLKPRAEAFQNDNHRYYSSNPARTIQQKERMFTTLWNAMHTVWQSSDILLCCIIGSFFEGAMYIFIFLWTPALTSIQVELNQVKNSSNSIDIQSNSHRATYETSNKNVNVDDHMHSELPFGWIFSTFMVCCMLGTITFSHLSNAGISASKCLVGILALSSVSFMAMASPYLPITTSAVITDGIASVNSISGAHTIQYLGMLVYEFCIGAYYPAMGTVKGTLVPEGQRAAIYNVFRLPLNFLVLINLVGNFSYAKSFLANAFLLLMACGLQLRIVWGGGDGENEYGKYGGA